MCLPVTGVIGLVLTTMLLHVPLSDCQNCDASIDAVPVCSGLTKTGRTTYLSGIEDGDNTTECFCSFSIVNDIGDIDINNVTIPQFNCDFYLASNYGDDTGTLYSCRDNTRLRSYTLNPTETVGIGIAKVSDNGNGFKFCLKFQSTQGSQVQLNCETFISFLIPPTTTKATTTTLFPPSTSAGSTAATTTPTTVDETTTPTTIASTTGSADQTTAATTIAATTGSADQTTGSTNNINGGGDETTTSSNNNGGETTSSSNNGGGGTTSSNNGGGGETTANNNNSGGGGTTGGNTGSNNGGGNIPGITEKPPARKPSTEDPDTELGIIIGFVVVLIILIIIIIVVAIFYVKRKNNRRNRVDIAPPTPKTPKK